MYCKFVLCYEVVLVQDTFKIWLTFQLKKTQGRGYIDSAHEKKKT